MYYANVNGCSELHITGNGQKVRGWGGEGLLIKASKRGEALFFFRFSKKTYFTPLTYLLTIPLYLANGEGAH